MGNITFTKYGTIAGGLCEKEHINRYSREGGAGLMFAHFTRNGGFELKGGKWKAVKMVKYDSIKMFGGFHAQEEVGGLRFAQDTFTEMLATGKWYTSEQVERMMEGDCAGVSGMAGFDGAVTGKKSAVMSDDIYQLKKKNEPRVLSHG